MTTECKIEFLQGEDGYYKKVTNALFEAVVKAEKNPEMSSIDESLTYHAKKIPGPVFRSWLTFCREVAARNKGNSEAGLMLMYHPEKKEWDAFPPKQDLSSVNVDFSGVTDAAMKFREVNGKEWLIAGTLHSHPGGASPSTTDEEDEKKMDGIHLIVPDFGKGGEKGIHAHIVASKSRFYVKHVPGFLVDFTISGESKYPEEWINQCKFDTVGVGRRKERPLGESFRGGPYAGYGYDGYGGGFNTGSESSHKGEGAKTFKITVDNREMNILSEVFESIESKVLLKKLGFSKAQRKFLTKNFEDDMSDLVAIFDAARDTLKYVKGIRGNVSKHEWGTIVDNAGTAVERALEAFHSISGRIIQQASDAPKDAASKGGEEEKEEDDKEVAEEGKAVGEVAPADTGFCEI